MTLKLSRREALLGMTAGAVWAGLDTTEAVTLRRNEPQSTDADIQLPPIDAARIARRVVGSLQPARGERAILVYDPTYYLDLTRAMEMELTRAGVHPIIGLTFDPPEVVRALGADPARKREEEIVSALRPIFEKADLFFWLPTRALSPDLRWERLLDVSRARGIHFHWITPPTGRSAEEIRMLTRIYERAILETDYTALSKEQDRLIAALRGQSLRVTTPDGTDLRMRVPRDAWFHKNDGDLSPARARLAKSVRDREMEFPCGALRFIPDVASVEGKLVVKRVSTPGGTAEVVTIEFERGRAVRERAEKNESAFRAEWQRIGGDINKVGEMVIGTNPLLVATLPSGDLPYYGYGAGYVRVSLGDNWESGGANRSPGGRPLWLFPEQASLEANGKTVIQRGQLVR
jgi:leucyl aminopeptidase (aminopeptidase T)